MCMKSPKARQPPAAAIDTTDAQQAEVAMRRKRSGLASMFRSSGGRSGDQTTAPISVKTLLGA